MNKLTYIDVLMVIAMMLRRFGASLGLMAPGDPMQLAITNGVSVNQNGITVYRLVVKRRDNVFHSPKEFGKAIQRDLDTICYEQAINRLHLVDVTTLPGDWVGLAVVEVPWTWIP